MKKKVKVNPDDVVKPLLSDELNIDNEEKPKQKRKKKETFDISSDLEFFVQLPFSTILPPALTEVEIQSLTTALSRWVEVRMSTLGKYSVDIALACAVLTVVLPRTNILKFITEKNAKPIISSDG